MIVTRAQAEFLEVFWVRGFWGVLGLGFKMMSWGFGFGFASELREFV